MAQRIQIRRGTTAEWSASDPVLADGEIAYDKTVGSVRVGDGVSAWSALSDLPTDASVSASIDAAVTVAVDNLVAGAPGALDTLNELAASVGDDADFAGTITAALAAKAAAADLTAHTGNASNPHTVTKTQVGLGNVDNTADLSKPVSTATQTALDGKETAGAAAAAQAAAVQRANHTGTQAQSTVTNLVSDLAAKAPLASPTFTGTVTVPTGAVAGAAVNKAQLDALSGTYAVGPTPNGTDDTAALQAAINSAITAGTKLALHPGVYKATTLNIDGVLTIEGAGADLTTIKALAGTTTRLINYSSATRREHNKLRHLTIDCTDAMTVQALRVHQQSRMIIHDVLIRGGAVGLYIETSSGSKFDNMIFRSQATSSLQIQGDGGLEFYFEKIDIRNDNPALTPSTGFEVIRTTATDVGGLYLDGVKITKGTGGAITNGIKIACSSGVAAMPTFMTQCVSDLVLGGAAVVLQNVSSFYLSLCYFSTDSTNASPALYIDGANTIQITNSFTYALNGSAPGSIQFVNAPSKLLLIGVRCPGGTFLHLPASLPPVEMVMESCQLSDTVAVANDMGRLVSALGVGGRQNISGPHRVLVATGGGPDQWFVLREPGGNQKGFRVSGGGTLQVMNNAGSVSVLNVTDTGNLQLPVSGAYIEYQTGQRDLAGSGTPEGVVTAPVGSTYRRTNGGAGTSFYVKESGTGNTGWVAK